MQCTHAAGSMAGRARARRLVLAGALMIAWLLLCLLPRATAAAVRRSDFPPSFLFGTATSSYQVHTRRPVSRPTASVVYLLTHAARSRIALRSSPPLLLPSVSRRLPRMQGAWLVGWPPPCGRGEGFSTRPRLEKTTRANVLLPVSRAAVRATLYWALLGST